MTGTNAAGGLIFNHDYRCLSAVANTLQVVADHQPMHLETVAFLLPMAVIKPELRRFAEEMHEDLRALADCVQNSVLRLTQAALKRLVIRDWQADRTHEDAKFYFQKLFPLLHEKGLVYYDDTPNVICMRGL